VFSSLDDGLRNSCWSEVHHFFNLVEECPQITNPFLDWRYLTPFWRNGQKKSENREIWANFDPPANFLGGAPQIVKPVLGSSF